MQWKAHQGFKGPLAEYATKCYREARERHDTPLSAGVYDHDHAQTLIRYGDRLTVIFLPPFFSHDPSLPPASIPSLHAWNDMIGPNEVHPDGQAAFTNERGPPFAAS